MFCESCFAHVSNNRTQCPFCGFKLDKDELMPGAQKIRTAREYLDRKSQTLTEKSKSLSIVSGSRQQMLPATASGHPVHSEVNEEPPTTGDPQLLEDLIEKNLKNPPPRKTGNEVTVQAADVSTENELIKFAKDVVAKCTLELAERPRLRSACMLIGILAIAATGIMFYHNFQANDKSFLLYSQADQQLKSGALQEALSSLNLFKDNFPEHEALPVVEEKIDQVTLQLTDQAAELHEAMHKAQKAFDKKRYLVPGHDNAITHLNTALRISPDYQPAIDLRKAIIRYYSGIAEIAEARKEYRKAIRYYQNVAKITPQNLAVLDKIKALHDLKPASEKPNKLRQTRLVLKKLQAERDSLSYELLKRRAELEALEAGNRQFDN